VNIDDASCNCPSQLHKKIAEGLLAHDASRLSDELESET